MTNWRDIGPTTLAAFEAEIRARAPRSPLLAEVEAIYAAVKPHSRLFLGMSWIENRFMTDPSTKFPVSYYNLMNMKTPDGSGWMRFDSLTAGAKGWIDRITSLTYKNGIYARTETVEDLVMVYAPPFDNNDVPAYVATIGVIVAELKVWEKELGGGSTMATKPYVLLVSGHRSYTDGGNPAEKALTDDLGRLYTQAFRDAGYKADWWQRDLDRDNDPDDTVGGLDTVSLGCANHLATISGSKVLLDLHFNGAHSPVHAIIPDSRGLTTAYSGGAPADDTYANNILDRAFAAKWAQDVANAFGLSVFRGRANEPGVMLEGETGVGLQGFRLATMAASARVRADTIRCVLEHAGTDDWGSGSAREAKFLRCAQIAVAAVNAVYNVTSTPPTPKPPKYAKLSPVPGNVEPKVINGKIWLPLPKRTWTALRDVDKHQYAEKDSALVGAKLRKGKTITLHYAVFSDDELWFVSKSGVRVEADAFVRD